MSWERKTERHSRGDCNADYNTMLLHHQAHLRWLSSASLPTTNLQKSPPVPSTSDQDSPPRRAHSATSRTDLPEMHGNENAALNRLGAAPGLFPQSSVGRRRVFVGVETICRDSLCASKKLTGSRRPSATESSALGKDNFVFCVPGGRASAQFVRLHLQAQVAPSTQAASRDVNATCNLRYFPATSLGRATGKGEVAARDPIAHQTNSDNLQQSRTLTCENTLTMILARTRAVRASLTRWVGTLISF